MSQLSKQKLVKRLNPRYLQASRTDKNRILDELVAVTGFHRDHAIHVLRKGVPRALPGILAAHIIVCSAIFAI